MSKNNNFYRVALRCHRGAAQTAQTGPNVWGFRSPDIDNHGQIHTALPYVHTLQFVCLYFVVETPDTEKHAKKDTALL